MKRYVFSLLFVLPLLCPALYSQENAAENAAEQNPATIPEQHDTPYVHEMGRWISYKIRNEQRFDIDLMFIGDSITELWRSTGKDIWDQYYGNRLALNFGVSGDNTNNVLWRLENLKADRLAPKVVVIMIGTNNGTTPEQTVGGIDAIVQWCRSHYPEAKIILLDVFPKGISPDTPWRQTVTAINKILDERYPAGETADSPVVRIDLADKFLDADGTLPEEMFPDFVHPTREGYKIWAETIEPEIEKTLGPIPSDPPEARGTPREMGRFNEKNEILKQGNVDVLMIGDSITHLWENEGAEVWDRIFDGMTAVNLGTGWDRTENVIWRLEHYDFSQAHPRKAFILIGINNSGASTPEHIARGVTRICEILREKFPEMEIYVQCVFPWGSDNNEGNVKCNAINSQIRKQLADRDDVTILDFNDEFIHPDGRFKPEMFRDDRVHLVPEGYERWGERLKPYLAP